MTRIATLIVVVIILPVILITSCGDNNGTPTEPTPEPAIKTETRSGALTIAQEATLQEEDLRVVTFASSAEVGQNGDFSVKAPVAEKYQLLFFSSKTTKNPVYLGIYDPVTGSVTANDTSTALALTLFNPCLLYTNQAQREEYLAAVEQNTKFSQLLSLLRGAYENDANTALDYDTNPAIYQVAVQLMKETMENLGGGGGMQTPGVQLGDPPYIEDVSGGDIKFVNPRHVWYAAGVHPNAGSLSDVATVNRKVTLVSFQWGWPPVVITEPEETKYGLGDGYFKLHLAKGFDFAKITKWNDPVGRGTILNTGQTIIYLVELVIGHLPLPNFAELPNHIHISAERAYQLGLDIAQGNSAGFIVHFTGLVTDNSEEIAYWIWQEIQSNAAHEFLSTAAGIFKKVSLVLELLGYVNEQGPFVWDLIFAPGEVTYFVTQNNGEITSMQENNPPEAEFSFSPPAGVVGTVFTFDASYTSDDNDNINDLDFRWDWQSDGVWDTGWSGSYSTTHSYAEADAYTVTLQARDSGGLIGSATHTVNVGGGAGTATHVKLFRDNLPWFRDYAPWNIDAMIVMLEGLGFTQGTGPYTYEIIASDQMSSVSLNPGEDLVIISNDQKQAFYNNYGANQVRFANFVYMGGSVLWEACDEGWAEGSMAAAGIVLPGNVMAEFDVDVWNYVTNQYLPLVSGLPTAMDHNYASHESFSSLPDGTTIYCVNEESEPTLIEFNLGGGWVIITGQPLEHQYKTIYDSPDMEELLPRIVAYFTAQPAAFPMAKRTIGKSETPSHKTN